jgi:hypothetical protein
MNNTEAIDLTKEDIEMENEIVELKDNEAENPTEVKIKKYKSKFPLP